jgi:hypothetical protein
MDPKDESQKRDANRIKSVKNGYIKMFIKSLFKYFQRRNP